MIKKFSYPLTCRFHVLYICLTALALLLGGLIYILFRNAEFVFFDWIHAAGSGRWFNLVRGSTLSSIPLPDWITFSLPDGLFAFAYALLITGIWAGSKLWLRYFWMASIPALTLGYEVFQYAGVVNGTFCMQDLAVETAGLFAGIIIGTKIIKSHCHGNKS
ncbi:MAG: hypothetical protein JXR41_04695 [Bacteroidales bacterium]|nr:hypothetical protein [Bacteroidales bacterium]MBN2762369.1 hypothetical protein [Bacteroidales bacterium]